MSCVACDASDPSAAAETMRRGADARRVFSQLSAQHSSAPLRVVPTPAPPVRALTVRSINTQQQQPLSAPSSSYHSNSSEPAMASTRNVVDLTYNNSSNTHSHTAHDKQSYRPPASSTYADTSDVFDDVDVDALVANHQQQQQQQLCHTSTYTSAPVRADQPTPRPAWSPPREATLPPVPVQATRPPPPPSHQNTQQPSSERAEQLKRAIKDTRAVLRTVRDECDDASLEGEIPQELQQRRRALEQKLEALSRQYRECNSSNSATLTTSSMPSSHSLASQAEPRFVTPSPAMSPVYGDDSANPRCSCGLLTTEAQVQHGVNAKRKYNRCSNCGFHSWASDSESSSSRTSAPSFTQTTAVHDAPCVSSDPRVAAKMQRAKRVLRDVFGHNAYRPGQERVVMESFSQRDVFVLMPTGGGKSLCYQLPACVDDGVTIVISPLVSLIQDQVQQLQALDVGVAHLNGEQDYATEQKPIINELYSSRVRIKLLYVTPEKIASSSSLNNIFESLQKRNMLARFVIDEAHCISQWGHDFRKDYMTLGQLRNKFPTVRPTLSCHVM